MIHLKFFYRVKYLLKFIFFHMIANGSRIICWKTIFPPPNWLCTFIKKKKNQLPISVWFYFCTLYSISLMSCVFWNKHHSVLIVAACESSNPRWSTFSKVIWLFYAFRPRSYAFRPRVSISTKKKKSLLGF